MSQFLGKTADQVLNTPGNPFSSGGWDTRVAIQNTDGSWRLNPDFNGLPLLIQYDVIADSTDPDGGASAATNVTVFLKSYFFDPGANRTNDVGATAQLVESRPGFLSDSVFPSNMLGLFGQGDGFVLPQAVPASGRGIEDADIRFTMEFDDFYRDRFSIDLATVTQKPQIKTATMSTRFKSLFQTGRTRQITSLISLSRTLTRISRLSPRTTPMRQGSMPH